MAIVDVVDNDDEQCVDDETYSDSYGDGCDWYAASYNRDSCGDYDLTGSSSYAACCVCGGGLMVAVETCSDDPEAADGFGDGCNWYADNIGSCGTYDTPNFAANEDCPVACGTC